MLYCYIVVLGAVACVAFLIVLFVDMFWLLPYQFRFHMKTLNHFFIVTTALLCACTTTEKQTSVTNASFEASPQPVSGQDMQPILK